ncbi:MAG: methyltransferase domain-containing protein [Alphaproteobacteria bacterium]
MATQDFLLSKKVKILQPINGYRASTDAVILSSIPESTTKEIKILDMGSGTGAVSLCLGHRIPSAKILGLEIQEELIELSNQSAELNGFENRIEFINHNIKDKKIELHNCFDVCITNPPYSEVDMKSPKGYKATAHNFDGLGLKNWIDFGIRALKPKGKLYMVNRAEALSEILATIYGRLGGIVVIPIYSKIGEDAKRIVVIASKDSKKALVIDKGIVVHNEDGSYSDDAKRILENGIGYFE